MEDVAPPGLLDEYVDDADGLDVDDAYGDAFDAYGDDAEEAYGDAEDEYGDDAPPELAFFGAVTMSTPSRDRFETTLIGSQP